MNLLITQTSVTTSINNDKAIRILENNFESGPVIIYISIVAHYIDTTE